MPHKDPERRNQYQRERRAKNIEREREYHRNWAKKNKAKIKQYYDSRKEERRKYDKKHYEKNKEAHKIRHKQWGLENAEILKQKARRRYLAADNEARVLKGKQYRLEHKEHLRQYNISRRAKTREHTRKRRAWKKQLKEHFTVQDELFTMTLFSNKCFNCSATENLQMDHIYPLSKGFPLTRTNACVLCYSCNASKNNKFPEEFYSLSKLLELFLIVGITEHSAFPEACDSLTCSCL